MGRYCINLCGNVRLAYVGVGVNITKSWGLILSLAVLECILSADNALVLSAFVKPLPKEQQKKALVYGLWGAYIFRFIFIGLGTFLIKLWWIKLIGAISPVPCR